MKFQLAICYENTSDFNDRNSAGNALSIFRDSYKTTSNQTYLIYK